MTGKNSKCVLVVSLVWIGLMALPATRLKAQRRIRVPTRYNQAITTPATPTAPATPPPESHVPPSRGGQGGSMGWETLIPGALDAIRRGSRTQPQLRPPQIYSERRYVERPRTLYLNPSPSPTPSPTPSPNVVPQANEVKVKVPKQVSPMEGRVLELSTRAAHCYSKELLGMIQQELDSVLAACGKEGVDITELQRQFDELQRQIASKTPWREIEPVVRELVKANQVMFQSKFNAEFAQIVQLLMVRDAFLVIINSDVRGYSGSLAIGAIPTGKIWIVYDPLLPARMGLLVNSTIMVCGTGGIGELRVVNSSAAAGMGLPVCPGEPVPEIDEAAAEALEDVTTISNPADAAVAVNYVLNGRHSYALQPGYSQKLPSKYNWTIEFDRGNNQGTARYSLDSDRSYEFRVVENRWELVKLVFNVTIDNRDGVQDFQYVTKNEVVTVKPGETKTHNSPDPVIVEFDRGEGPENPSRKSLNKSGTYKVAVNTQDNYLDLFAKSETQDDPVTDDAG